MQPSARTRAVSLVVSVWAVMAVLAVVAGAAVAQVSWLTYGFDVQRTGYNASENALGTGATLLAFTCVGGETSET